MSDMTNNWRCVVAQIIVLVALFVPQVAGAQEPSPVTEDGVPYPVTDTNMVLDSEASTQDSNIDAATSALGNDSIIVNQSSSNSTTFLLIVMLALFGFYIYNNQSLNNRISRLELALRGGAGRARERDELVPFSWNAVLRSLEGGFAVLPGLMLPRPCVMALGVEPDSSTYSSTVSLDHQRQLIANAVRTVLQDPESKVLALLRHTGSCDLGHQILEQLSGKRWADVDDAGRQSLLQRHGKELEHYEKSLCCLDDLVLTPEQLYRTCTELLRDGELGAIILDDLAVLVPNEQLETVSADTTSERTELCEALRLIAARCHVPIFVVTPVDSPTWKSLLHYKTAVAVARFGWTDQKVRAKFAQNDDQDGEKTWQYFAETGAMSVCEGA